MDFLETSLWAASKKQKSDRKWFLSPPHNKGHIFLPSSFRRNCVCYLCSWWWIDKSQTLFGLISPVTDWEGAGLAVWKHLHRTAVENILGIILAPQLLHSRTKTTPKPLSCCFGRSGPQVPVLCHISFLFPVFPVFRSTESTLTITHDLFTDGIALNLCCGEKIKTWVKIYAALRLPGGGG